MDWKIGCGDARELLRKLPEQRVNCCVTSPPYWGLREYKGEPLVWGGERGCEHEWGQLGRSHHPGQVEQTKWKSASAAGAGGVAGSGCFCIQCGAWRGSLGLEPTPELYVEHLVSVFRAVKRVMRDDGTLWINLGDSYNTKQSGKKTGGFSGRTTNGRQEFSQRFPRPRRMKQKDLVGIPWMVAFALRADGWYLRMDNIWHKPNPMPSSVRDRCTHAHEYMFHLSKSAKYYYDADAISEDAVSNPGDGKTRNKRSVWTIVSQPFKGAHFAVFPQKLVEPCILAGCPERGIVLDPFCGAGTTGLVALKHNRRFIGIDLNPDYVKMASARLAAL